MRRIAGTMVALTMAVGLVWAVMIHGCGSPSSCNPKEVNVIVDSTYKYHLEAYQDTVHLSLTKHEFIVWTFDQDTTVDSVTAVFGGSSPFASHRFEFSDSAAFSGLPTVSASATRYIYTLTVYPHGQSPVTVDPGVIIED